MLTEVIMPTLGLDIEEAVIERWLKREGERVLKDEPLLVVETDKASMEISAPRSGTLSRIVHPAGSTVPVTQIVAYLESEGGGSRQAIPPSADPTPEGNGAGSLRISPAARRIARELGVDVSLVSGSGPRGRIQGEDVRRFAEARDAEAGGRGDAEMGRRGDGETGGRGEVPAEPAALAEYPAPALPAEHPATEPAFPEGLPGRMVPLGRKRRLTAERMALSARSVARITLNAEIDASELIRLRERLRPQYETRGVRLSYDAVLARAVATAMADHPHINARWTEKGIYLVEPINVGVAMAMEDGLVVPVVRHADRKRLPEVAAELDRLLERARQDRLTVDDITGGTFTITNLGMLGIDSFTPIVNPPESAILGVGRIVEKPVGRQGQIVLRQMMTLSLSVDHRVVDGAPAARFLQRLRELLEEPYLLL